MKHTSIRKPISVLLSLLLVLSVFGGVGTIAKAAEPHTHDEITFAPWESTDSLPADAGSYVLTDDVTVSATWAVPAGETNLCLDGHHIYSTFAGNAVRNEPYRAAPHEIGLRERIYQRKRKQQEGYRRVAEGAIEGLAETEGGQETECQKYPVDRRLSGYLHSPAPLQSGDAGHPLPAEHRGQ